MTVGKNTNALSDLHIDQHILYITTQGNWFLGKINQIGLELRSYIVTFPTGTTYRQNTKQSKALDYMFCPTSRPSIKKKDSALHYIIIHPHDIMPKMKVRFGLSTTKSPKWHISVNEEVAEEILDPPNEPIPTTAEVPHKEPEVHLPTAPAFPILCVLLAKPLVNFWSSFHKHPLLNQRSYRTLLMEPPRKCVCADFEMPPVDPKATRQLRNLPTRYTA